MAANIEKKKAPVATMKDLLARKMERDNQRDQTYEIYVPSMERCLVFKPLEDEVWLDLVDEAGDGTRAGVEMGRQLIYYSCEQLQDPELHQALGVKDPLDTVKLLFSLKDVLDISSQLTEKMGLGSLAEEIKN